MTANSPPLTITPPQLAAMLRQSADIVERNEFHPLLYQTMKVLTAYAADYAEGGSVGSANASVAVNVSSGNTTGNTNGTSAFHDVPDSVLDGPTTSSLHTRNVTNTNTASSSNRPQSGGISSGSSITSTIMTPGKAKGFSLKGIKKGLQKIGGEFIGEMTGREDSGAIDEQAWCDVHFTRGCGCKVRNREKVEESTTNNTTTNSSNANTNTTATNNSHTTEKPHKPCFQRPINPSSNLIANGWIDQQRRSKMRVVWKDVLASLVEGRSPGEETTLWIQRQVLDATTGKVTGLEALHQVPMKWLEDVNYVDIYGDHRFTLKVYNIAEEFYFRTRDEQSAQSWVLTLRSARDASLENARMGGAGVGGGERSKPSSVEVGGMGLNNLDDWDTNSVGGKSMSQQQQQQVEENHRPSSAPTQTQTQTTPRITISELRSIAHGAGYDTRGMERQDLERIAAMVRNRNGPAPTSAPSTSPTSTQDDKAKEEAVRKEEELMKQQKEAEMRRAAELEQQRRRQEEMERRRLEDEERKRQEQLAAESRRKEEMDRQRQIEERRRQEEERQRQVEEQRRRQEEDRQRQVEQQAAQIKARQEEERRKRVAELQAAEMKRGQEEADRRKQQQQQHYYQQQKQQQQQQAHYQQQQQQQHQQPHQQQHNQFYNQNTHQGYPQQGYHARQQQQQQQPPQQQQFYNQNAPNSGGYPHQGFQGHAQQNQQQQRPQPQQSQQQQQPQQQQPPSKYMESKDDEAQSASTLKIKRNILIHWALQPPNLNVLRPIDQLITTIHTALPGAYGVPTHEYFSKFTPITRHEISNPSMGNHPDETKLKKAVRKVRVFLHPDKLPRDLSADQSFMARMLWDITSDSWEEFLKHKDELDWIRS